MERAGHETLVVGRGETIPVADAVVHLGLYNEMDARAALAGLRGRTPRLIVASSGDVYRVYGFIIGTEPDPAAAGPLDEEAPLRTSLYPYGREARGPKGVLIDYDKILVELVVREVGAVVLRLPKVYGPGGHPSPFEPYLLRLRAGAPIVVGQGVARWRWTHGYVEDVAEAFVAAAADPRAEGRIYNVGEEPTPTLFERVRALTAIAGGPPVAVVPDAEVPSDLNVPIARVADVVYDTRRIRDELGWRERVAPQEALRRTVDSFRASG
jgi:nucleoside-diphosphate-sugar epimerase